MGMRDKEEWRQSIRDNIEEHGWFCQSVFYPEGNHPNFSYSVGFTKTLAAPEFIIFGLKRELMHAMLWEVFRQLRDGASVSHGQVWDGLLGGGYQCYSFRCTHADLFEEYALSSQWFWHDQGHVGDPEVYQIVWPGAEQRLFPWEEGCAKDVIDQQPQLFNR